MRVQALFCAAALAAVACGRQESKQPASGTATKPAGVAVAAARLEGAGWIGDAVDPTLPGKVHALAFFKPG